MTESHAFEHEGHTIEYFPATVRTDLARFRYLAALIAFFGHEDGQEMSDKDPEEWANVEDYAINVSQCKTDAPWWVGSMAGSNQIGQSYTLYMEQDAVLRHQLMMANRAVRPPKKMIESESQT